MFSGFGPEALSARMCDSEAKLLITATAGSRQGKQHDMLAIAHRALAEAPYVEHAVVVERGADHGALVAGRDVPWDTAIAIGGDGSVELVDPNDPLMIVYTSGTTGKPKGIVLSQGGFLVKVGHDLGYSLDVQSEDVIAWITDFGWLVAPILIVGGLLFNATILLAEGTPVYPDPGRLWSLVETHQVTLQGISPTVTRTLRAAGDAWVTDHDRSSLRGFASTGEPWDPEAWLWLFQVAGSRRLPIFNYAGGTEVGGGILTCYPILPLKPCSFAGPVIGMDVDIALADGDARRDQIGELAVRNLWPGMTHGFWRDRDRYLDTYWSQQPGTWIHGDLAFIDADGYWYITGRSDDLIKVAGRRVGPAEIEAALNAHPSVAEAAAVGVPHPQKGQEIIAFVVLRPDESPTDELRQAIQLSVIDRLGKTLAPRELITVLGLPKTKSGKILRRTIRARYLGQSPGDLSSMEDPAMLDWIPALGRGGPC
jgi:acetyl-CoA synthetase